MRALQTTIRQQGHIMEAGSIRRSAGDAYVGDQSWYEEPFPTSADPCVAHTYYDERTGYEACAHCGAYRSDDDDDNDTDMSSDCDNADGPASLRAAHW